MTKSTSIWPKVFIVVGLMLGFGSVMCMTTKPDNKADYIPGTLLGFALFGFGIYRLNRSSSGRV